MAFMTLMSESSPTWDMVASTWGLESSGYEEMAEFLYWSQPLCKDRIWGYAALWVWHSSDCYSK